MTASATHTAVERSSGDLCLPFFASRPEQPVRGIRQKIPFHPLADRGVYTPISTSWPILECSLSSSAALTCSGATPPRVNPAAMLSIAARFQVPIWVEWTPYFLDSFRKRHFLADCFKRNLGFEVGRMVLSFLHFGSLLSSCDPPDHLVRIPAATSKVECSDFAGSSIFDNGNL